MKIKYIIISLIIITIIGIIGFIIYNNSHNNSDPSNFISNYDSNKTEAIVNTPNQNDDQSIPNEQNIRISRHGEAQKPPIETEMSTFSTPIVSDDESRQHNVELTCEKLNDTIVENGATFSFCDTLGPATTDDGFQKAEIFDSEGNKIMGLGGGKCQVSSTLYNAILAVPTLEVTERHEHSNKVPYIESGKDAAVYYGSYDLKFVNHSGKAVKIKASTDGESITTTIVQLN